MAQLSDDCFAFGGPLLPLEDALKIIAANVRPSAAVERVPLDAADGRVLAEDVLAPIDLPPFANSAVDGYAVRAADLGGEPSHFPIAGRLAAGDGRKVVLEPRTAWRIFTGAALPEGADTVFMQEDVRMDEPGRVLLPKGLRRGANTRGRGEDVAQGSVALPRGRRLRPQDVALAAALGLRELVVRRAVHVAIFSTGAEVVGPGEPLGPGQLYDANRVLLRALARRAGATVTDCGILPDSAAAVIEALRDATDAHDLILTSGGVSTGEEDHVRAAIETLGRLVFWRLAIKPGRPVAMGVLASTPMVGLPGNPVAAFLTFVHIAWPLIAALSGTALPLIARAPVRAAFSYRKKRGRREYLRVRLSHDANGELVAHKHPQDGAGILSSLTETDGVAELMEETTGVAPGDWLNFLPYTSLL